MEYAVQKISIYWKSIFLIRACCTGLLSFTLLRIDEVLKNLRKASIALILAVLFISFFSIHFSPANASTEEKDAHTSYFQRERCENRKIEIKINNETFHVMRYELEGITLEEGVEVYNPRRADPAMSCSITQVDAIAFRVDKISVRDVRSLSDVKFRLGTYLWIKEKVDHALASQSVESFPNGTKYFQNASQDIYVLPKDVAPTLDGSPVVMKCTKSSRPTSDGELHSSNFCDVSFSKANGLLLKYRFIRKKYRPEEYLNVHLERLAYLEALKLK